MEMAIQQKNGGDLVNWGALIIAIREDMTVADSFGEMGVHILGAGARKKCKNKPILDKSDIARVQELCNKNLGLDGMAKELGCSVATVWNFIQNNEIEYHKKKRGAK